MKGGEEMKWVDGGYKELFPPEFRRFCCGIDVILEKNKVNSGSGILSYIGLVTSLHLIEKTDNLRIKKINATFIMNDDKEFSVEVGTILYKNKKQDLVVFDFPYLDRDLERYLKFVKIGWY